MSRPSWKNSDSTWAVSVTCRQLPKATAWLGPHRIPRGKITREELQRREERATAFWIEKQEELGIDVLVDGEQYRGDMVAYFAENLPGFEQGGLVRSYGNRYYRKPIIVGEIKWTKPITVAWWKFAQSLTKKPVKGMLTGPTPSWTGRSTNSTPTGAPPAWRWRRSSAARWKRSSKPAARLFKSTSRRSPSDPKSCRSRWKACTPSWTACPPTSSPTPATALSSTSIPRCWKPRWTTSTSRCRTAASICWRCSARPFTKDITFGVVDSHSHVIEDVATVRQRIEQALTVLKPEQLWLTRLRLQTRTIKRAVGKLR
jgi:5-methyltetrahydropteroyltriglutamate--homocysteine methyltransferase